MEAQKQCEQCHTLKDLSAFYRRKNKTDNRMRICIACYTTNRHEEARRARERAEEWEREKQREQERKRLAQEAENTRIQALLETRLQGPKACQMCLQTFPANDRGDLVVPFFTAHSSACHRCNKPLSVTYSMDGYVSYGCPDKHMVGVGPVWYGRSDKYCPICREEQRKKNRQAYPLCPLCSTPTRPFDFLRRYKDYRLDIIRVCCKTCAPRFEAMPEQEQLSHLRKAMVKTYGETAVIYGLRYEACETYHHIGRTKHLTRRMAEYRRNWDRPIHSYSVLEEVPFGALSMERESRWILHALKYGWPIDNLDMFEVERLLPGQIPNENQLEVQENQRQKKARLIAEVADLEPLTTPFEQIAPLISSNFMNTRDIFIAHWFYTLNQSSPPG